MWAALYNDITTNRTKNNKHERKSPIRYTVSLSGDINTGWRAKTKAAIEKQALQIELLTPNTDHESSDECGIKTLDTEEKSFWKDHKAAKTNSTHYLNAIKRADIVVVRCGDKYKQWNAAFDAGMAAALGKSLIDEHVHEITHLLKEIDCSAMAVAENTDRVIETLGHLAQEY